ncbi:MAG: hypothetical protein QW356_02180 [Candidatus Hadarchaeales archaeon]
MELSELTEIRDSLKKQLLPLVREIDRKFFRKRLREAEDFLKRFVYSGDLCCCMLAAALRERKIKVQVLGKFPDLELTVRGGEKIGIEIKRLISCSNLVKYVSRDVVEPLQQGKWRERFGLVLLFPQLGQERPERIQKIVDGFRILEEYLREKGVRDCEVLCKYIEKRYCEGSPYSFGSLVEDLLNRFKIKINEN